MVPLKKITTDSKTVLVFVSRSGRHGAVAVLTTALPAIVHNVYEGDASSAQTIHLSSGRFCRSLSRRLSTLQFNVGLLEACEESRHVSGDPFAYTGLSQSTI